MSPQKLLQQVVGATLLVSFLVGCGTPSVKPSVGKWIGVAEYRTAKGAARVFEVQFEVNQDGKLADDAWVWYAEGPVTAESRVQGIRTSSSAIAGDSFSAKGTFGIVAISFIKVEFEGTFVSPSKLEGTFKVNEDNGEQVTGKWTAEPSQSRSSIPTVTPKPPEATKPAAPTAAPPTAAPKPTEAPKPTAAPQPTATRKPTEPPKPTAAPQPTAARKPTEAPKP